MARVRGQHQTMSIVIDDVVQLGSFAKLEDFTPSPKADLTESDFIGESETDFDFQHHGWGGNFTIHESEKSPLTFYNRLVEASAAGTTLPKIDIVVVTTYVDRAAGVVTEIFQKCVLKLSGRANSGRKEFIKNSFEFACKRKITR